MYFVRVNLWYTNYISIQILKLKKNVMPLKSLLLIFTWDSAYPYMGLECVCAETDIDTHIYKYMNQNNTTSKLITENNEIFNFHTNPHGTWRNSRSLYNFSYIFITHVHVPCSFKWESTHRIFMLEMHYLCLSCSILQTRTQGSEKLRYVSKFTKIGGSRSGALNPGLYIACQEAQGPALEILPFFPQ